MAGTSYNDVMNAVEKSNPQSITESPWYWAYLFCTGGLVVLVTMGPRYTQRQTQIEQNGQKRQWAAQHVAGRTPDNSQLDRQELSVKLWPLYIVLGSILAVAWSKLIRDHLKRRTLLTKPSDATENDDGIAIDAISADGGHK
jgi:hypothetical protein